MNTLNVENRNSWPPASSPTGKRVAWGALAICWILVVFDGFDLISYGAVQNELINNSGWGIDAATAGTLGSMAFVGMTIGAIGAGRMSDAFGRRRTIVLCALVFSVFTGLCALSTGPVMFGAFRLIAGLGLGGLVPSANAIAAEVVPAKWRPATATAMMSGVPIGGTLASLTGISVIPAFGWHGMFVLGVIPVVLIPFALKLLPETLDTHSPETQKGGYKTLLSRPYLVASILFAIATLFTLFAWYGLGTQLPKVMADSGYNLGAALTFTVALNLGAVLGSIITAWAGNRFGAIQTGIVAALLAGGSLIFLITPGLPVPLVYLALLLAGVGTHGTQCLIIAAIASAYPSHLRGTSLGWALGVGRIGAVLAPQISGLLLATDGLSASASFVLFGGAALIASCILFGVRPFVRRQAAFGH